jgi:hypothetical protein
MDQTPGSNPPDVTYQSTVCTGNPTSPPRRPRLRWLVLAHVAASLSTGMLARREKRRQNTMA